MHVPKLPDLTIYLGVDREAMTATVSPCSPVIDRPTTVCWKIAEGSAKISFPGDPAGDLRIEPDAPACKEISGSCFYFVSLQAPGLSRRVGSMAVIIWG